MQIRNISKFIICILISLLSINPVIGHTYLFTNIEDNRYSDLSLSYSTYFGGSETEIGWGIASDDEDNFYIAAVTSSLNFPLLNEIESNLTGDNLFVAKFNSTGELLFSTIINGHGFITVASIALDPLTGNIVVAGNIATDGLETKDALQEEFGGETDCAIIKLTEDGQEIVFSTYLGGSGSDTINDINIRF